MKCLECDSVRFVEISTAHTLLGFSFYVVDGVKHIHDPNWWSTVYECENGHTFSVYCRKGCNVLGCQYPRD